MLTDESDANGRVERKSKTKVSKCRKEIENERRFEIDATKEDTLTNSSSGDSQTERRLPNDTLVTCGNERKDNVALSTDCTQSTLRRRTPIPL